MQIPAIVKGFCNLNREISILHNRGSPYDKICGLTMIILPISPAVNETNC